MLLTLFYQTEVVILLQCNKVLFPMCIFFFQCSCESSIGLVWLFPIPFQEMNEVSLLCAAFLYSSCHYITCDFTCDYSLIC